MTNFIYNIMWRICNDKMSIKLIMEKRGKSLQNKNWAQSTPGNA